MRRSDDRGPVATGPGAGAAGVALEGCCSAGRVAVPGRLKFWSSRGPIASVAGVFEVGVLAAGAF